MVVVGQRLNGFVVFRAWGSKVKFWMKVQVSLPGDTHSALQPGGTSQCPAPGIADTVKGSGTRQVSCRGKQRTTGPRWVSRFS